MYIELEVGRVSDRRLVEVISILLQIFCHCHVELE